ncbi:MAG: hypothetical protein R3248_06140 [Candidatus Promineifilaceae bacterium]|nr:hypothetical protein [Candidatus Promineifilaceae bacterium]
MRLLHLAGCFFRAVKVVPIAAIASAVITMILLQGGGQFRAILNDPNGRLFFIAFAGIFGLAILAGLRRRSQQLGCLTTLGVFAPFLLLGAVPAYIVSALVVALQGGAGAEGASTLSRFWSAFTAFPPTIQAATAVGALSGLVGLAGDDASDDD